MVFTGVWSGLNVLHNCSWCKTLNTSDQVYLAGWVWLSGYLCGVRRCAVNITSSNEGVIDGMDVTAAESMLGGLGLPRVQCCVYVALLVGLVPVLKGL